jgi:hypothetical protein
MPTEPISSVPISSLFSPAGPPGPPAPPGPTGTLPEHVFNPQEIHCRWNAHYASSEVNQKFLGIPLGIYFGFVPQVTAGSLILTLGIDPVFGVSFARTRSLLAEQEADVVFETPITLDFTGHDFVLNPTVYVKLKASVAVGQPTSAEVFTSGTGPAPLTEQLICVVTKPAADLVVTATEPANRSNPYAWASATYGYGFMKDSAVEQLLAAVDMVNEVAAARLDLDGVTHPYNPPFDYGLDDRIGADLQPDAIASRLALFFRVVRSNAYTAAATTNVFDVSSSFAQTSRTFSPMISFNSGGNETTTGATTDGDIENRNICFVVNDATRERLIDADRLVLYGRLTAATTPLTGTITFTNAVAAIVGIGTLFLTELALGALVIGPDGQTYSVLTITDNFNVTLGSTYAGVTVVGATASRRVFTLTTYHIAGGVEIGHAITIATVFHFYFPAWVLLSDATFDAQNYMLSSGEEPPLPNAAVGVEGKVFLHPGTTGGLGGAVLSVKDAGSPVGSGVPVFGLDFTGAAVGAPGVADISASGPVGPVGPGGGSPGAPGPTGPTGTGFGLFSSAFSAGPFNITPPFTGWPTLTVLSHNVTYPGPPKYIHGGLAQWLINAPLSDNSDHIDMTNVTTSGNQGTVLFTTPNLSIYGPPAAGSFRLYLNAAG